MSKENPLNNAAAKAIVPEQLLHYVRLTSEVKSKIIGSCLVHVNDDVAIVIGYPLTGSIEPLNPAQLAKTLDEVVGRKDLQRVMVLAPFRPAMAPEWSKCFMSGYLMVPLPFNEAPARGVAGFLAAKPKVTLPVKVEQWSKEHAELAQDFMRHRNLSLASRQMFEKLEGYLKENAGAKLFCARDNTGKLAGCLLADLTSEVTAFNMLTFSGYSLAAAAGDSAMRALIAEADRQNKKWLMLGPNMDRELTRNYRDKWGAREMMPLVQTSWELNESGKAQARYYKNEMARRQEALRNENPLLKLKRWIGL